MALSVILPTLNEAENIQRAIASLRQQGPCEIIVADGGSSDDTLAQAAAADRIVSSPRGRALQMNAGAVHAAGDLLLFLHADCLLEQGALSALQQALQGKRIAAACFSMRVQAEGWAYRLIDRCATARVRLSGIIYGDQGLALRRETFEELGGFPRVRFLEDVLLSRKLRRAGRAIVLPQRILVSPRRWQRHGLVRQTLRNWALTLLAVAGVPADGLARFYPLHAPS